MGSNPGGKHPMGALSKQPPLAPQTRTAHVGRAERRERAAACEGRLNTACRRLGVVAAGRRRGRVRRGDLGEGRGDQLRDWLEQGVGWVGG